MVSVTSPVPVGAVTWNASTRKVMIRVTKVARVSSQHLRFGNMILCVCFFVKMLEWQW